MTKANNNNKEVIKTAADCILIAQRSYRILVEVLLFAWLQLLSVFM